MKEKQKPSPFGVRMPEELHEWLRNRAKNNFRSMSAEIVRILTDLRAKEEQEKVSH